MCGIALLYSKSFAPEEQMFKMQHALSAMQHRGPDDDGTWQKPDIIIGHRRLSIIDLVASHQPMADPTGRFVLTYNGEIYNYRQLRADLERKWTFQTAGDTEVLLAGLVKEGHSFLKKMEGMWGFALWDNYEKSLLLCRDRMGKKPLYYQQTANGIACASELPALACLKDRPWEEDLDSSADYLKHGYYLPGFTIYKDVKEVLPGQFLSWSLGKQSVQRPYWTLPLERYSNSKKQAMLDLEELMVGAVEKRMVADVEVGAFLSGGVDSSLIVSIMTNRLKVTPKTFTIGFQERSYDERKFAEHVALYCNTDHYTEEISRWDRHKLTDLILKKVGQPFADSSLLPTSLVSEIASRHVKVALSGDGGDELFSGYQRYQARSILRWYTRLPKALRKGVGRVIRLLPEPMAHHSRSLLKKAHLFQDIIDRLEWETPYIAPVLYSQQAYSRLAPDLVGRGHTPPNIPEECSVDDIQQMMTADALIYLPQDILLKVDRASMSCSLETRAPFLDRDVVELAFSLPCSWHRYGLGGKRMLHDTFSNILPERIWLRRKQGFGVPIHNWFKQGLGEEFGDLLISVDSVIDGKIVARLFQQHQQGQRDHSYRLWTVYIYLLWKSMAGCHQSKVENLTLAA